MSEDEDRLLNRHIPPSTGAIRKHGNFKPRGRNNNSSTNGEIFNGNAVSRSGKYYFQNENRERRMGHMHKNEQTPGQLRGNGQQSFHSASAGFKNHPSENLNVQQKGIHFQKRPPGFEFKRPSPAWTSMDRTPGRLRGNGQQSFHSDSPGFENHLSENLNVQQKGKYFQKRPPGFGFRRLQLFTSMDPEELVVLLNQENENLFAFLNGEPPADLIVLFVRCLHVLRESHLEAAKTRLMIQVCKSRFIELLPNYIMGLPYVKSNDEKRNLLFWDDVNSFFENLLSFIDVVINVSQSTAIDTLRMLFDGIKSSLEKLVTYRKVVISDGLLKTYDHLQLKFSLCVERVENKMLALEKKEPEEYLPPNDIQDLEVLPTKADLLMKPEFLQPNIVDGAYSSTKHYLDVQFRLLREDFISPLRDAVLEYLVSKNSQKHNGARFYKKVKFLKYAFKHGEVVLDVRFQEAKMSRKAKTRSMKISKRFMFGSLLCFTCDDFDNIIFGTVSNRDDIDTGIISVEILGEPRNNEIFDREYLMLESETYYPPYCHTLQALQKPHLVDYFPFEDYIVNIKSTNGLPRYVKELTKYKFFNRLEMDLSGDNVPAKEKFDLDQSQYDAFFTALFREFVIIQGPPGTGKTFIGLKIAETLLMNLYLGSSNLGFPPILVICYTNHALDQFLEGLLNVTKKIVRIGGQSKNTKLNEFNLNKKRFFSHKFLSFKNTIREKAENLAKFQALQESVESSNHIIDLFKIPFSSVHIPDLKEFLRNFNHNLRSPLVNWLLLTDLKYKPSDVFGEFVSTLNSSEADKSDEEYSEEEDMEEEQYRSTFVEQLTAFDTTNVEFSHKSIQRQMLDPTSNMENIERDVLISELHHLQARLSRGNARYPKVNYNSLEKAESFNAEQRWALYWEWLNILKGELQREYIVSLDSYRMEKEAYKEVLSSVDLNTLGEAHVIGMTTSSAARLQTVLRSLRTKIVIVEEAAEVMEAQVVVSLTKSCQHLIMIGDHQQLRPKTASYRMAKKFNLDISLFERMVKNGSHCNQLMVQHRMRPEFARLICPSIYPNLVNHPSVCQYPPILGVVENLFFIDHNQPENKVDHIISYKNEHEARFILHLAKHLILQGYEPSEVTILATYAGQMFLLKEISRTMLSLKGVQITILDNYQGEENKIILLSLVRSNQDRNIGFLATDNRVCVALSRAQEGFYIIGNMSSLKAKSKLWNSVNTVLEDMKCIGEELMLKCEIHDDTFTPVRREQDFSQVVEGGCWRPCGVLMFCGHNCPSVCHSYDRLHEEIRCTAKCARSICKFEHECPLLCFEECQPCMKIVLRELPCGHKKNLPCSVNFLEYKCLVTFSVELPLCGHKGTRLCYQELEAVCCQEKCMDRLACGHPCARLCHKKNDPDHLKYECREKCARLNKNCSQDHACLLSCYMDCNTCTVLVEKIRTCTHKQNVPCHEDVNSLLCNEKCKRALKCGHFCKQLCNKPCEDKPCETIVEKTRQCGHKIKLQCSDDPTHFKCKHRCNKLMVCGHPCKGICGEPCTRARCTHLVPNPYAPLCGHVFEIPCSLSSLDQETGSVLTMGYCGHPCGVQLEDCEHGCRGTCGKCAGGRLHMPCQEPCGVMLVCGHVCKDPCRQECPPCQEKCTMRCQHSKCPLKCGVPCTICKKPCTRQCKHGKCKKLCGEVCDIPDCQEACERKQKCGHPCRGLCGERCPEICGICKPEDLPDILFGNEHDDDARFVILLDCRHVMEVTAMDKWVESGNVVKGQIAIPGCPQCLTPVVNTPRYSSIVKRTLHTVDIVKKKIFGQNHETIRTLSDLQKDIASLKTCRPMNIVSEWLRQLEKLEKSIESNMLIYNSKQTFRLSILDLSKMSFTLNVLQNIMEIYSEVQNSDSPILISQVMILLKALDQLGTKVSGQISKNINNEVFRLRTMVQLMNLKSSPQYRENVTKVDNDVKQLTLQILLSLEPFDATVNKSVCNHLNRVRKMVSLQPVTEQEKLMIVKAMGFKQGHWYACPNGHPYCISDCGGAMERSVCPECKLPIGGEHHRLDSQNTLASSMDGAVRPAWPP